ncbi:MAG: ABC-2 type transport system permease protein [Natronomonas sp.]|jgi:ABC-2 type transport system permease protein|uniref:ABC transporter permease subunit n=1 Tax=Natronomonas sp. TaxID=2184060 RepID=UPI00398976DF
MSWLAVAEKDFHDAIRSRLMIGVAVLFVLFTVGGVAGGSALGLAGGDALGLILQLMLLATGTFVPIIAIAVSYRAIAGELESGSLKLLLSLPNSRSDIVIGKFLGRSAVVGLAVVIGFLAMLIASAAAFDSGFDINVFFAYMLSTLLLALVFVSIAVSVSAFTASTFPAALGSFGIFVLFQYAWTFVIRILLYAANGFERPGIGQAPPDWAEVVFVLNPTNAYSQATRWLLNRVSDSQQAQQAQQAADSFYLEPWFGFIVLAIWIFVPLAVGYLRFESVDL